MHNEIAALNHRTTEHPELEGTRKDHSSPTPGYAHTESHHVSCTKAS